MILEEMGYRTEREDLTLSRKKEAGFNGIDKKRGTDVDTLYIWEQVVGSWELLSDYFQFLCAVRGEVVCWDGG